MMSILLKVATFIAAAGVIILLAIEIGKLVKFIKSIDKNKVREKKEQKERDALASLIAQAEKKIAEIDAKKKK